MCPHTPGGLWVGWTWIGQTTFSGPQKCAKQGAIREQDSPALRSCGSRASQRQCWPWVQHCFLRSSHWPHFDIEFAWYPHAFSVFKPRGHIRLIKIRLVKPKLSVWSGRGRWEVPLPLVAIKEPCLETDTMGWKKKKRQKNLFDLLQLTNGVFAVRLREEMIKYGEKSTLSNILWPIPILFV